MPDLKMLNSTKYLYKLTFIKCSYARLFPAVVHGCIRFQSAVLSFSLLLQREKHKSLTRITYRNGSD